MEYFFLFLQFIIFKFTKQQRTGEEEEAARK